MKKNKFIKELIAIPISTSGYCDKIDDLINQLESDYARGYLDRYCSEHNSNGGEFGAGFIDDLIEVCSYDIWK